MTDIYDRIAGLDANGDPNGLFIGTLPFAITLVQVAEGTLTAAAGKARYTLNATEESEFDALVTYLQTELQTKTREAVIIDLYITVTAVEYGYVTKQAFKTKFGIQ